MKTTTTCLMILGLIFAGNAFAADPTNFEELKAHVGKTAGTHASYKMDMVMTMNMQGMEMKYTGKLTGKGEKMKMDMDMDMMGQIMKMTMVMGGDNMMHMYMDGMGQKQAMKMNMDVIKEMAEEMGVPESALNQNSMNSLGNPKEMLEQFESFYDVEFKGKQKLGDEDVYVVNAKIKSETVESMSGNPATAQALATMTENALYIGVEDGMIRKLVSGDPAEPAMTQTYSNIEINPDVSDDIFELNLPEGIQVMDLTEMMKAQMGNL